MSITILECREADAVTNPSPGDWQTVLASPVVLENGDQVLLKNAIIDTTTVSQNNIVVSQNTELTITAYPYVTNYQFNDKSYFTGINAQSGHPTSVKQPDGQRYYACVSRGNVPHRILQEIEVVATRDFADIDSFSFTLTYFDAGSSDPDCIATAEANPAGIQTGANLTLTADHNSQLAQGDGSVTIMSTATDTGTKFKITGTFLDGSAQEEEIDGPPVDGIVRSANKYGAITSIAVTQGTTAGAIIVGVDKPPSQQTTKLSCPHKDATAHSKARVILRPNLLIGPSGTPAPTISGIPVYPPDKFGKVEPKVSITVKSISEDSTDGYFEPQEFAHTLTVPKGNYPPATLCKLINDSLTRNESDGSSLLANDMLKGSNYLGATPLFMLKESNPTKEEADGFRFFNSVLNASGKESWVGSSQFELAFDPVTSTFRWNYLHTPLYTGNPGAIAVQYEVVNGKYTTSPSSFGVALAKVESDPPNFWEGLLGFDTKTSAASAGSSEDDLQCHTTVSMSDTFQNVGSVSGRFPTFSTKVGSSTTSQYVGSDTTVQKNTDPYFVPSGAFTSTLDADNTVPIIARAPTTKLNQSDTTGYFYIDITSNFRTNLLNSGGVQHTLNSIVTRYENTGSYTIGTSDNGILYTHTGEPQMLQSLSIRILNPDKTLASSESGIGSDNTILLQVVKTR